MRSVPWARRLRRETRSQMALAVVIGVAVLREGSEVVLFLNGIFVSGNAAPQSLALGGVVGLGVGALLSFLTYRGLVRIPHLMSSW
jgi:high-affinity iron transporter